jgi:hypothetical protein
MTRIVCEACGGNGRVPIGDDPRFQATVVCSECRGHGTVDDTQVRIAVAFERIATALEGIRTQMIIGVVTLKQR